MLNNVANPMGYLSNKPLVNSLSPLAQKQRSGLNLPPQAEAYLLRLMLVSEDIFIGQSHPEQTQNVATALRFIKNSKVSKFQLTGIRQASAPNATHLIYGRRNSPKTSGSLTSIPYVWSTSQQDIMKLGKKSAKKPRKNRNPLTPAMALAKSFLATITSLGKNA